MRSKIVFATSKQILLETAVVGIYHRGETFRARALIDSGSRSTFISKGLQRKLGLPTVNIHARVSGLYGTCAGAIQIQYSFVLTSLLDDKCRVEEIGLVLPKLTGMLHCSSANISRSAAFSEIILADPKFNESNRVDINWRRPLS